MNRFLLAVTLQITVGRLLDCLTGTKVGKLLMKQLPIEGIWMIEVDGSTLFLCHVGCIIIIRIQRNNCHEMRRQSFHQSLDHGSLTASGTTSDTDHCYFIFCHISYFSNISLNIFR